MIGRILSYIKYYFTAKTVYHSHSAFVLDFLMDVLDTTKEFYAYPHLEHERKILLFNNSVIDFEDLGAGNHSGKRKVSEIAKSSLSPINQCRLLFNMVNKYNPSNIIELGTSLGLSTLYMAKAAPDANIYTIEGNPASVKMADILFEKNHVKNITTHTGNFDDTLPNILMQIQKADLIYIDGNHQKDATIKYFNWVLPFCHKDTVLIFDDIYWSSGMTQAWRHIQNHEASVLTIDTYDLGFVFFNEDHPRKDTALIQAWKKPWSRLFAAIKS